MASKILERMYLDGFLKTFSQFEVVDEREAPDFVLRDPTGSIGFELVQLFRDSTKGGSRAKAIESRRQRFLVDLARQYYAAGGRPVLVKACLPDSPIGELDRLIERIQLVRRAEPWAVGQFSIGQQRATFYLTSLPEEAGSYRRWLCINNNLGWVGTAGARLIAAAIREKSTKLPTYRAAVGRVALLLVADGTRRSGMLRWSRRELSPSAHGFDAVYLYRHPNEAIQLA